MHEGPIMITIEYQVRPEDADAFIDVMHRLGEIRQRNGGYMWELFNDINRPGIMIEFYLIESMVEMLRQRERMTVARPGNPG